MKSKVKITWLEQQIRNKLYVDVTHWGEFSLLTKTDDSHPTGNDFIQNYFTKFLVSKE